jgi:hypothetical protein
MSRRKTTRKLQELDHFRIRKKEGKRRSFQGGSDQQ